MTPTQGPWARWGWLATTLLLGASLVATAWVGRQRAIAAKSTLDRGQAEVLLESVRQFVRADQALPDDARLDSLLRLRQEGGLRFLSLSDSNAAVVATAGTPIGPAAETDDASFRGPLTIEDLGDRLRLRAVTLPARPPGEPRGPRGRPPVMTIEFEPLVAHRLVAEATRTFLLSGLVAATLVAAAIVLWRLSLRQEQFERRLEQQRRLSALGEMSAVLAHEIRNPLASLKGHAQLLAERLAGGSADRDKAELVVQEAKRLEALTTDLLDFARSGPIDLHATDPVALLRTAAADVGGGVVVHGNGAPPSWPLDEQRTRQALANVLRNSRQVSPDGRDTEATVGIDNGALVYTVRDFGPGIVPGDEQKIFSPFYTTRTTGTGLGLAVALRVAEMHGGTIAARNHPEGGAVFTVRIPRGQVSG